MHGQKYKSEESEYLNEIGPGGRALSLGVPMGTAGAGIGAALAKFLMKKSALKGAGLGALLGGGLGASYYNYKPSAYRKDVNDMFEQWDNR